MLIESVERKITAALAADRDSPRDLRRRASLMLRATEELREFAAALDLPRGWSGAMLLQLTRAKERGA